MWLWHNAGPHPRGAEELKRFFAVIWDKRDKALSLLAYRHGLRASDIGLLQRTDVALKQGRITIHRLKGSPSDIYPLQLLPPTSKP